MHSNYQKAYRPNPHVLHLGTERIVYFPRNNQGENILKKAQVVCMEKRLNFYDGRDIIDYR